MRYHNLFFVLLVSSSVWSQQKDTLTAARLPSSVIVISACTQKKPFLTHIDSALNQQKPVPSNKVIRIVCARRVTNDDQPLFIVDGITTDGVLMRSLTPSDIETIVVLKEAKAVAKYGDAGKHGVIIITTKSKDFRESVIKNIIDSCQLKAYPDLKGL